MDHESGSLIRDPNAVVGNGTDDVEPYLVNYLSVPSLLKTSLLSIVSQLWQVKGLGELYAAHKRLTSSTSQEWQVAEKLVQKHFKITKKQVSERLAGLRLPEELRLEAEEVIMPVGVQLLKWLQSDACINDDLKYIHLACWTAQCTIHEKRTALVIFDKYGFENIIEQFKVAANVCAEELVVRSWHMMTEDMKRELVSGIECVKYSDHLLAYWVFFCNCDLHRLSSVIMGEDNSEDHDVYDSSNCMYTNMCSLCVYMGRVSATEYFWHKLTDEKRRNHITLWIRCAFSKQCSQYLFADNHTSILCFLLSNLQDMEQANKLFRDYGKEILLSSMCRWPLHRFILPTLSLIRNYITENFYPELILELLRVRPYLEGNAILNKVWAKSPTHLLRSFWKHLTDPYNFWRMFSQCLYDERREPFRIIFENIHPLVGKKMAFNLAKYEDLYDFIKDGGPLTMLDMVLGKILSSESDIKSAKRNIAVQQGSALYVEWAKQGNWDEIDSFFSWCFSSRAELDAFKRKGLRKAYVGACLFKEVGLETLDNFVKWCFDSQKEIDRFKRRFALAEGAGFIYVLSHQDWSEFEEFLRWAFKTNAGVRTFKAMLKARGRSLFYETNENKMFLRKLKRWLLN